MSYVEKITETLSSRSPVRPWKDIADPQLCEFRPLLSRQESASYLGVKTQTLAAWASSRRVNLPYVKIGRRVMYRRQDLEAFCAANVVGLDQVGVQHG